MEKQKKQQEQVELIMSNIVEFGKYSYNLQEKREESLINQSGRMITAYSVTAVIYNFLLPQMSSVGTIILFFGLLVSLGFAAIAGWRFKYDGCPSIDAFYEDVHDNIEKYNNQYQFNAQWKNQISKLHKNKKKNNDKRAKWLVISMSAFLVTLILPILISLFF